MVKKLIVAIHDLHPWGGQDKSNLEILYRVNDKIPIDLHAYQFVDPRPWKQLTHSPYSQKWSRISVIKQAHYILITFFQFLRLGRRKKRIQSGHWIQTTGTASLVADIVQIQFIHTTWQKIISEFEVKSTLPIVKAIYQNILGQGNSLLERLVFDKNKKFVAISHAIKKELIKYFSIPEEQIVTIYHGVDTEEFCPFNENPNGLETRQRLRKELGVDENSHVLLHVGALNERKGVDIAIRTLGYLYRNGVDNLHYVAIGSGNRQILNQIAEAEGVKNKVHFISHSKNVRDYYWAADIFFFPTIYEPFGLVILEALSSGLCCVVSSTAGATELITHKENGLLIKNIFDPATMGDQLLSLVKNVDLQKQLSKNARLLALNNSWDFVAQNYLKFYASLDK